MLFRLPLSLLLVLLGGCGLFGEPDRAIVVDGVVVDAATGVPIDSVSVQLDGAAFSGPVRPVFDTSVTGDDGRFRVERGYNIDGDYRVAIVDVRLLEGLSVYYRVVGPRAFDVAPGDRLDIRVEMERVER